MGNIYKRDEGIYLVRVYLGRDPATGKQIFHNHTIHGTKRDAETYRNGVLRDRDLGTFVQPSSSLLNEHLDEWLTACVKSRVSQRTYEEYESLLRRYIRPVLGCRKLSDIRPAHVQALYSELQQRGLSARTIRYTHTVLSSALKQAVKWRTMAQNPAALADLPRLVRKEMQALSPKEAGQFLAAAQQSKLGTLFSFVLITGLRPSEFLGLQWKDVDLDPNKGTISVQRALHWRSKQGWYFAETKTSRSRRSIPLPTSLVDALRAHRKRQHEERLKLGQAYQQNDLVFATRDGGPLNWRNVIRYYKEILKVAGLPETMRLYDLRHTCATLLLAANENPKVVSERLGHASVTLTLDVYSHVLPTMQKAASDKLERLLLENTEDVSASSCTIVAQTK